MKRSRSDCGISLPYLTRLSWLNLGTEFGVPKDVRRMIYKKLTMLDLFFVELAHGVRRPGIMVLSDGRLVPAPVLSRLAGEAGHIELFRWLIKSCGFHWNSAFNGALNHGRLEAVKWCHKRGVEISDDHLSVAAKSGDIPTISWALIQNRCSIEHVPFCTCHVFVRAKIVFRTAMIHGHVNVLNWLRQDPRTKGHYDFQFFETARAGSIASLEWAYSRTGSLPFQALNNCFRGGLKGARANVLKWVASKGYVHHAEGPPFKCSDFLISVDDNTGETRLIEVIKCLRELGHDWGNGFLGWGRFERLLDVIRWSIENGFPFDVSKHGHELLKVSKISARQCRLDILDWLVVTMRVPITDLICTSKNEDVLKWTKKMGHSCYRCEGSKRLKSASGE